MGELISENKAAETAARLRYKRPALASLGYETICQELYEIQEACQDVQWFMEQGDETLLNALGDDEEAEWEFRMAFADLDGKAEELLSVLSEWDIQEDFDDCTVALIGKRYDLVGFDSYQEDYYSLVGYDEELANKEAGKRLMRHTKAEMISIVGQCLGALVAFLDLRQQYDYLKAAIDVLRDENTSLLKLIKEIDAAYEVAEEKGFRYTWYPEVRRFDKLLEALKQHGGSVILSGYPSEMYDRELRGWNRIARKSYNQNADQRTEVLWCNFELPSMFFEMEGM